MKTLRMKNAIQLTVVQNPADLSTAFYGNNNKTLMEKNKNKVVQNTPIKTDRTIAFLRPRSQAVSPLPPSGSTREAKEIKSGTEVAWSVFLGEIRKRISRNSR